MPTAANAARELTRVSIAPAAQYVSAQQINVELSLSCEKGQIYGASAFVRQEGPFGPSFGSGGTNGVCTGGRQKVAITVFGFQWQLGDALVEANACAFACDNTSRAIRIDL